MSASPFTSSTALFGTPETEQQQQQGAPSPGSVEPNVLPLHQGGVAQPQSGANADLEYQRQLLAKKLSEKYVFYEHIL